MSIFSKKPTDLDLNGPILSFTSNPTGVGSTGVGVGSTGGGTVSISGIVTTSFAGLGSGQYNNAGYVTYVWYEQGVGVLEDSTYITGQGTTTLTLSNLITPTDNQRKFYLQADYIPSYYFGDYLYETGNANNEPFNSGIATVTVDPLIEIISQPTSTQALINTNSTISVDADLTDSYYTDDLSYQWYVDGDEVTDGVKTDSSTTGTDIAGPVSNLYNANASHQLPSVGVTNLQMVVAGARGGAGGRDGGGPGGLGENHGRAGRFIFPATVADSLKGTILTFRIGSRGNDGGTGSGSGSGPGSGGHIDDPGSWSPSGDGGKGGNAGPSGWSGAGGGGGAASYVSIAPISLRIIVAGGGGGGGGGSLNRGGQAGFAAGAFSAISGYVPMNSGDQGSSCPSDGGGGGGGGGGSPRGSGGSEGYDNNRGGRGGGGGGSKYGGVDLSLHEQWLNDGNGYASITYTGYTSREVTTTQNTTLSGTTTKTLTIASDTVGVHTCRCKITSASASNSSVWSDVVNFITTTAVAQNTLKVETIGSTASANISTINLNNGDYTMTLSGTDADNNGVNQFYSIYSPDKDMDVEMDLYGGKGSNNGNGVGGEGGYSRIRFTMKQNEEYVIAGLIAAVNAPFVYYKGTLLACVGQGGNAGSRNGGYGGGVNIDGTEGKGRQGGAGGKARPHEIISNGIFGSSYTAPTLYTGDTQGSGGGRTIRCTKGVYWRTEGFSACQDVGSDVKFFLSDGTEVTNTAAIQRGFKAGYNIMQTAGKGTNDGGVGGNGATGGFGGAGESGGGGGSGYENGTITVVNAQLGGSTDDAKVVLRVVTD